MQANCTLTRLGLGGNRIGAAGVAALAEALKVETWPWLGWLQRFLNEQMNRTLTILGLDAIKLGAAGAAVIAEALKVPVCLAGWRGGVLKLAL